MTAVEVETARTAALPKISFLARAESILGVQFENKSLLVDALGRSAAQEKLEWLGDRVVNFAYLRAQLLGAVSGSFSQFFMNNELPNAKLAIVATAAGLAEVQAEALGVRPFTIGLKRRADLVESVIGAVALDQGTAAAEGALRRLFGLAGQPLREGGISAAEADELLGKFTDARPKWAQIASDGLRALQDAELLTGIEALGRRTIDLMTGWTSYQMCNGNASVEKYSLVALTLRPEVPKLFESAGYDLSTYLDPVVTEHRSYSLARRAGFGIFGLAGFDLVRARRDDKPPPAAPEKEPARHCPKELSDEEKRYLRGLRNEIVAMQRELDAMAPFTIVSDKSQGRWQARVVRGRIRLGEGISEVRLGAIHEALTESLALMRIPGMPDAVRRKDMSIVVSLIGSSGNPEMARDYIWEFSQELAKYNSGKIRYEVDERQKAPAERRFNVRIRVHAGERPLGKADGPDENTAKQAAAKAALELLRSRDNPLTRR